MMNHGHGLACLSLFLGLLMALTACSGLKQSYPEKYYYALNAQRPAQNLPNSSGPNLLVGRFRVSPRYEGKSLVYRTGDLTYQADYYNEFLVSPASMFGETTGRWLAASGLFKAVLDGPSQILPDLTLECAVNSLYGDFRPDSLPKAILGMQVFLIQTSKSPSTIIWQHQ
ncbi:MAG: hypothetical protein HQK55_16065, partial [Deltaproteobacteria bacterium]|nr:hypothetical protein [Deltaproteobacteria bacterium]